MSVDLPRHELDEEGEHDPGECQKCIEASNTVICSCACGDCCRHLIIETTLADAEREPLVARRGTPIRDFEEVVGFNLNDPANGYACTFLDQATSRCTIWATRPGVCRLFDCDSPQARE